jgi:hypothetical protein
VAPASARQGSGPGTFNLGARWVPVVMAHTNFHEHAIPWIGTGPRAIESMQAGYRSTPADRQRRCVSLDMRRRAARVRCRASIPPGIGDAMSRTIYIIDDATLRSLGDAVISAMVDEMTAIYAFASQFTLQRTTPDNIPEQIDFTDSIVKIVAADDDVSTMDNQAELQELRSIEFAVRKRNLRIKMPKFQRSTANPDRGGIGWQAKEVLSVGRDKVALVQTGGVVSAESAAMAALTFTAPNGWTLEEAEEQRRMKLNSAKLDHGQDQDDKIKKANASYKASEKHWQLKDTPVKSWPAALQKTAGIALGRLAAHEVRHQYVAPHFDDGGLGGDGAEVLGVEKSTRFLEGDRKNIMGQVVKFETAQRTATIHLETFPQGQAFAFKE